ncbi:hypothetical protein BC827DRAFT_1198798 [Russula dissimulans]|nr:hypothetical protein BC827DRAFT_1198798 [Russula dissimulans]
MNVGSKTDHESAASSHPVGITTITANAGKPSSTLTAPQPTLEKRRASAEFSGNGSNNSNGLVASFAGAPEFGKPDSKVTTNGQGTAISTANIASQPPPKDTLNSHSNAQSPSDDDDASGTSASPPTPLSTYQDPSTADDCITSAPSSFITTTATEDTTKPSQDSRKSLRGSLRSSRGSLSSSRPAPPSPADSRRASTALSRQSSTRSHPGSITPLTPANTNDPGAASPTTPTPTQPQQQQSQQTSVRTASASSAAAASTALVKIRDFAFPDEDVRHTGTGPFTPRPNRRLQRPLSTWSASSASSAGSEDHDEGAGGSSHVFSNWGLGRLGWFGMRGTDNSSAGSVGDGPSQGDFARNFTDTESPGYEVDDPYESLDDDDDDDDDNDSNDYGVSAGGQNGEHPLLPGLYRALYAFEPEGTAETALEEDQIVRVIGRGGGVGWAIVARGGDEGHALVPEGYLELVSLDRDQVGEEEG